MIKKEFRKLYNKASFSQKLVILVVLFAISFSLTRFDTPTTDKILPEPSTAVVHNTKQFAKLESATVARVIDGDTIVLIDDRKVRYIGIDTPETVDPNRPQGCFGKEASAFNIQLVDGQHVWLEKDVSDTDRYGRLLRYVYILPEGAEPLSENLVSINELLLTEGYAISSEYKPDIKYQEMFEKLQQTAIEKKRGMWADEVCTTID